MDIKSKEAITDFLMREASIILSREPSEILSDAPLPSLGFDSLSFVELLIAIERQYHIKLMDAGWVPEDVKTLDALAASLVRHL